VGGRIDISFLDVGTSLRWAVSVSPLLLYPPACGQRASVTHGIRGRVSPRAEKMGNKNSLLYRDSSSDPSVVEPVGSLYTDHTTVLIATHIFCFYIMDEFAPTTHLTHLGFESKVSWKYHTHVRTTRVRAKFKHSKNFTYQLGEMRLFVVIFRSKISMFLKPKPIFWVCVSWKCFLVLIHFRAGCSQHWKTFATSA
jgi:hypothetical protein